MDLTVLTFQAFDGTQVFIIGRDLSSRNFFDRIMGLERTIIGEIS